jgi:hypothetical protein
MRPIYSTSGCPKNQKRCWNSIGSPPPATSKKEVLKFLSVNNIVIAPANTGKDNNNNTAVTTTAQPNKVTLCNLIPGALIFNIVVIKFIAPNNELTPDKCKPNIPKSTLGPLWLWILDKGGYNVHPVPTPFSILIANKNNKKLGGNNQYEILFNLGKAISGPPIIIGIKKLPNPPISPGITIKNIITIAWAVIILLYNWLFAIYWTPGPDNSILIKTERDVPTIPENKANIKYNTPISFALADQNHLSNHWDRAFIIIKNKNNSRILF